MTEPCACESSYSNSRPYNKKKFARVILTNGSKTITFTFAVLFASTPGLISAFVSFLPLNNKLFNSQ